MIAPAVEYWKARAALQANLPQLQKETVGGRGKFAPFEDVVRHLREPMMAAGLVWAQNTQTDGEGRTILVTCVVHAESGQGEASTFVVDTLGKALQGNASATQEWGARLSYAKRYALQTATGLPVSNDPDPDMVQEDPGQPERGSSGALAAAKKIQAKRNGDTKGKTLGEIAALMQQAGLDADSMRELAGEAGVRTDYKSAADLSGAELTKVLGALADHVGITGDAP